LQGGSGPSQLGESGGGEEQAEEPEEEKQKGMGMAGGMPGMGGDY